jgi:hypothetical protein
MPSLNKPNREFDGQRCKRLNIVFKRFRHILAERVILTHLKDAKVVVGEVEEMLENRVGAIFMYAFEYCVKILITFGRN